MPAFSVPPSVRARRALVRPAVRRTAVGLLAAATALSVASLLGAVDDARDRWGATRPVAVATRDLSPGEVLDSGAVEVRDLPEGVIPDAAVATAPTGAVVRHPILAGEPLAPARLAPDGLSGTAALVAEGERAVAVPVGAGGAPPLAVGDLVDVGDGRGHRRRCGGGRGRPGVHARRAGGGGPRRRAGRHGRGSRARRLAPGLGRGQLGGRPRPVGLVTPAPRPRVSGSRWRAAAGSRSPAPAGTARTVRTTGCGSASGCPTPRCSP